jgi:hypothetical protein
MNATAPPATPGAPPQRPSRLLLLFAPFPGIGHWVLRRAGRGLLTFMVFAAGVNLIVLAPVMAPVARISPAWGWTLAALAVAFSLLDVTRIVLRGEAPL